MRICFELLDLLKAHKKGIRRAAVNSFGHIAKSLGPQDVLSVLLTNLRVQERQSRVCSTVAIAIVAETCGPFTCIPAILNEYRTAELNVRTGCLKALTFGRQVGPTARGYCADQLRVSRPFGTSTGLSNSMIAAALRFIFEYSLNTNLTHA
jgi:splicing factor 3B subunit 1